MTTFAARRLVELEGVEPSTSCLQSRRSGQLSYSPTVLRKYQHAAFHSDSPLELRSETEERSGELQPHANQIVQIQETKSRKFSVYCIGNDSLLKSQGITGLSIASKMLPVSPNIMATEKMKMKIAT